MSHTRRSVAPGLSFSRIACGMAGLAEACDTSPGAILKRIGTCLDHGITTLDQADIYGGYRSEELLGAALAQAPELRDRVEIVTKCGIVAPMGRHAAARLKHYDTSPDHIARSVEASLRLMGIERIDLLLIHRPDPFLDPDATGAALDRLVAQGKVAAVGVSNFRPHDLTLLQSRMQVPLCANQIELGLATPGALTNGDLAFLHERRLLPMAWSPLGGGALLGETAPPRLRAALDTLARHRGVTPAAVALGWLLAHPAGILPVIGSTRPERIAEMAAAFSVEIDRQTWFDLYTRALGNEVP
ncbi:oxidoreductase [Mesobaculum littorinae]|uniref:Oxidoreductase n=1 Tax=Mesobaculum littorinae TaxID=2486419 RepID=A0A438AJT3_9RHOB|nr:aldo/keto reductase [Mesobaculum littorinae]RVV98919.1 oxidoreductase [Mesobaculum littorinae]